MNFKSNGFTLTLNSSYGQNGARYLLTAVLLFIGLFVCILRVLGLQIDAPSAAILLFIGAIYCIVSCGTYIKWRFAPIVALVVPMLAVVFGAKFVVGGWNATANQIFATAEIYIGRIFPRYAVDETANVMLNTGAFLLLPTILLAVICGRSAARGGAWRGAIALISLAILAVSVRYYVALPVIGVAFIVVAGAAMLIRRTAGDGGRVKLWLVVPIVAVVLIALVPTLIFGGSNAVAARKSASETIHSLRYPEHGSVLPEGDFRRIPQRAASGDDIIGLSPFSAEFIRLRGFVGEVYNADGWTELPPGRRAEYATLFSWLHDRGFYAQNQNTLVRQALSQQVEEEQITVTNNNTCTEYVFAPYETFNSVPDVNRIGDENIKAAGFRGDTEYTVTVANDTVADYEQLYSQLTYARRQGNGKAIEYLTSENAYREFVYENYLEISGEARAAVEKFLNGLELPEGRISFTDAKLVVNTYLNTLTYQTVVTNEYDGGDFLTGFLETHRTGNSFHFATVSTLMFRYLGIPARYVEGYNIIADGTDLVKTADAWAEIYRDGVGFVPFEMTMLNLQPQEILLEQPPIPQAQDPFEDVPPPFAVTAILAPLGGLIALALVAFALLALRRLVKLRRLRALFGDADRKSAISAMTAHLIRLLSHAAIAYENGSLHELRSPLEEVFGHEHGAEFEAVIRTQQAALFSREGVADSESNRIMSFAGAMSALLLKQQKPLTRFKLKWIECL